jgi:hypothetical protein
MNLRSLLIGCLSMLFGSILALTIIGSNGAKAQPREIPMSGRYQVIQTPLFRNTLCLFDTATGEGWGLESEKVTEIRGTFVWSNSKILIRPRKVN